MSRSRCVAGLAGALGLALAVALLSGCARGAGVTPAPAAIKPDPVKTLQSLHNKIVYVVETSNADASSYTYRLYWIDPIEKCPHLLLTSKDPVTEHLTTLYLPGRAKMLVHMAPSRNTRTGNDYVADIDGSDPRLLVRGHVTDFFPDGKHILVSSDFDEGGQTYFLYMADMSGKILKRLTSRPKGIERKTGSAYIYEGDWGGTVSPDGKSVVYASSWFAQRSLRDDLFRINADGSGWTRLTHGDKTHTAFSVGGFSHDGTQIAVTETRGFGTDKEQAYLAFMDTDGRIVHRSPLGDDGGGFVFGGWSPSDDQVAVVNGANEIAVLDVKAGSATAVTRVDETVGESISSVAWLE